MNRGRHARFAGVPTPNSMPGEEEGTGAGMTRAVVDTVGGGFTIWARQGCALGARVRAISSVG